MEEMAIRRLAPGGGPGRRRADQHGPEGRWQPVHGTVSRPPRTPACRATTCRAISGARLQGGEQGPEGLRHQRHARRPDRKDRLWFFGTFRRWSANNYLGNTFALSGAQAIDDQHISDGTIRLTTQVGQKNKLSLHYDRSIKWRGHRPNNYLGVSINDPLSDVVQTTQLNYIGEIKWTSTMTNRLLAEAGCSPCR